MDKLIMSQVIEIEKNEQKLDLPVQVECMITI